MKDLFDTHFHLTDTDTDLDAYYERAASAGVRYLLAGSSGMANTRRSAEFAARNEHVYFTAGIHPHEAETELDPASEFEIFSTMPRLAAIGEIGLDFYYDISSHEPQIRVFRDFLNLALRMNLPAVVHCRDKEESDEAYRIAYDLLSGFAEQGGTFVLHSFAGTPGWAEKFLKNGSYFGVGGLLTFRRAENIRTMVATLPLDRILLETDSPYLAPVPYRGKPNHPEYLPKIAEKLAELRNITPEECAARTTENAFRFFHLKGVEEHA